MAANVVILAAQRPGVIDPLAADHQVSHKCLIPVAGKPLIAHVLRRLARHPEIREIRIAIEPIAFADIRAILQQTARETGFADRHMACVAAADNLADSVQAGMAQLPDGPTIITTADNALLTDDAVDAMLAMVPGEADVAVALAPKAAVLAAHPDGQRRFYKFSDNRYSNCNLYALSGREALSAAEIFRGGGQFAKKAERVIDSFGVINLLLLRSGWISLPAAMRRLSRRIGLTLKPVVLADGRNAIDVDNDRSYRIVSGLLDAPVSGAG